MMPTADMFVTNGPAAAPLATLTARLQEGLDLLNHGFVVEALLTTFSTFESNLRLALSDAIRRNRDEPIEPGRKILKRVRDRGFPGCVESLPSDKSVGWKNLRDHSASLCDDVIEIGTARNHILHHGAQMTRREVEFSIERLWQATDWLVSQVLKSHRSLLRAPNLAIPQFFLWKPGDAPVVGPEDGPREDDAAD